MGTAEDSVRILMSAPQDLPIVQVADQQAWRQWLDQNHDSVAAIWLKFAKKGSPTATVSYGEAIEEALCFGWIDGTTGKLDANRYVQRFTPRRPTSRWSAINIRRARRMIAAGKMTAFGRQAFRPERKTEPHPTELPKNLQDRFLTDTNAWQTFQAFPPFYRRMTIAWVASAKKEATQLKRLQKLMEFSSKNKRIKFM